MSAPDPQTGLLDSALAFAAKLWPGVAGSLIALRWQPSDSTRIDRALSALIGVVLAMIFGPMVSELAHVSSPNVQQGIGAVIGMFGLVIVGQLMSTLKEIQLGALVSDWLRAFLRLK